MSCCNANHDRTATRAAMCAACRPARRLGLDAEDLAILCINGVRILDVIEGSERTCPRGRWPDEAGNVRWLRVVWMGVPAPLRYWIRHKLSKPLPGCGCIASIKRFWESIVRVYSAGVPAGNKGVGYGSTSDV